MPEAILGTKLYYLSLSLSILFSLLSIGFTVRSESSAGTGVDAGTRDSPTRPLVYNATVVIDEKSKLGAMANICISMALTDFYAEYPNYRTRLSLQTWDSLDGVAAASSDHLPQPSTKASFAIKLVESSSDPSNAPFLIKTNLANFSNLAKTMVATLDNFEWNQVTLIYEDMEYGNQIVPYLIDALENGGIQLSGKRAIPTFAKDFQILEELELLMSMPSKVFVVHMTTTLASRLFVVANKAGMMSKEFAWLITSDGLSNFVDTMDNLVAVDSLKGVLILGIRPYLSKMKAVKNFKMRYKKVSMMKQYNEPRELNLFGLWVYDTIQALAMTVERIVTTNSTDYIVGARKILKEILRNSFSGNNGDFDLVSGQLQPSTFEIFNLTGKRVMGYWTLDRGISQNLDSARTKNSTSWNKLKKTIIPIDTRRILKGDDHMPKIGEKWRIGVPNKTGFTEFVNIKPGNKKGDDDELPGFSIEVFKAVWKALAIPPTDYEFVPFDGAYDDLCCLVNNRTFDAAVGDISIVASRTNCVDFTLPYMETGVAMLIKVSHDGPTDMWIFLKPLSWDLWMTIFSICIFIGIVIRILDRRKNTELINGSRRKQLSTILMFPCLSVAVPQRDMVATNCSRLVLVIWIFLAFVLMQSYTANLSSILTVNQLQPTIPSLKELRTCYVGYQTDSFVGDFLINQLEFNGNMLKPYNSVDDYQDALSKGSKNDGVSAIFYEIPYIKLFLDQHPTGYIMVGPTYRTDGLGFAFPIGFPLVANFSREILNFTQGKYMNALEKKYFGKISIDQDEAGPVSSSSPSLTSRSFAGLFIIIGTVVLLALLVSENHILGRLLRRYIFCNYDDVSQSPSRGPATAENEIAVITNNLPTEINNIQGNHISNQSNNTDEATEEDILEDHSS